MADALHIRVSMNATTSWLAKHLVRLLIYGSLGAALVLVTGAVIFLNGRQDLSPWHTEILDQEFRAGDNLASLSDYLSLEQRLFEQLHSALLTEPLTAADRLNRFRPGSLADPQRWPVNWNRTFIMPADQPRAGVLLLHGMSDSPYSLRSIGQALHRAGAHVVGLRLPGHGTAPSGLLELKWEDMAAAVTLAAAGVQEAAPGVPFYIVGYSNGGALAVNYAFDAVLDADLPQPERLVLLSPEIGITGAAALAVWQARLGHWLGLDKLAWTDIQPEYDPFKYNSFAVNAGDVAHRLTHRIQRRLRDLGEQGQLHQLPPILAFTSAVDATVSAPALVNNLFNRLPAELGHRLVIYDINHRAGIEPLLKWQPADMVRALLHHPTRHYQLHVISNRDTGGQVTERIYEEGSTSGSHRRLDARWPEDVYSLSHVALPFAIDDPLYGADPTGKPPGITLGNIALRGERGVLFVGADAMLRLRWNPFYDHQLQQIFQFLDGSALDSAASP